MLGLVGMQHGLHLNGAGLVWRGEAPMLAIATGMVTPAEVGVCRCGNASVTLDASPIDSPRQCIELVELQGGVAVARFDELPHSATALRHLTPAGAVAASRQ